jgi:hypothetical protein
MSNPLINAWVKNVYSLRIGGGLNSGYMQRSYTALTYPTQQVRVQTPTFTQVSTMFSSALSTLKMNFQPLLIVDLYPVSTAPTIKRTKEKLKGNS